MLEFLGITLAELQFFLLIFSRIMALTLTLPIISSESVPKLFSLLFAFFLAMIANPILPVIDILPVSFAFLGYYAAIEIAVGLCIGLVSSLLFEAITYAGFLVSELMGLAMVTVLDPNSMEENDVLGQLSTFVAILLILALDGHHFFIKTIFDSFYLIPVSKAVFSAALLSELISQVSLIFVIALKIGAPLIAFLFMQRVIMALFARFSPDLQILMISLPLSLLMGFYILSVYWSYFAFAWNKYFELYKSELLSFIKLLGGG